MIISDDDMNLSFSDSFTDQQRCRPWIPLLTQQVSVIKTKHVFLRKTAYIGVSFQLRLRHLRQITAYNVIADGPGQFYYTLHLTSMSAPFYTSEEIDSPNPKWTELDLSSIPSPSSTGVYRYDSMISTDLYYLFHSVCSTNMAG